MSGPIREMTASGTESVAGSATFHFWIGLNAFVLSIQKFMDENTANPPAVASTSSSALMFVGPTKS